MLVISVTEHGGIVITIPRRLTVAHGKRPTPLSHRTFKRAGEYADETEAMAGLSGPIEDRQRLAKARMSAQKLAKRIKREGIR